MPIVAVQRVEVDVFDGERVAVGAVELASSFGLAGPRARARRRVRSPHDQLALRHVAMARAGVNGLWCRDRHVTQPPDDEVINMLVRRDGIPT